MKKVSYLILASVLIVFFAVTLLGQGKANDPFGKPDKAEIILKPAKANQFTCEFAWENDEKLGAMEIPLIVRGKDFKMHYDSVSWKGRIDYFAVKSVRPIDSLQQVLIGLLADMTGKTLPLNEGKGTLATLYFTAVPNAKRTVDVCEIMVDTTFIPPSNTLSGVIPDGTGSLFPVFTVARMTAAGQPATCK